MLPLTTNESKGAEKRSSLPFLVHWKEIGSQHCDSMDEFRRKIVDGHHSILWLSCKGRGETKRVDGTGADGRGRSGTSKGAGASMLAGG